MEHNTSRGSSFQRVFRVDERKKERRRKKNETSKKTILWSAVEDEDAEQTGEKEKFTKDQ